MVYYEAVYWDDIDQETRQESGLVEGSEYSEAALQLHNFYGKGQLISLYMEPWDDIVTVNEITEKIKEKEKENK